MPDSTAEKPWMKNIWVAQAPKVISAVFAQNSAGLGHSGGAEHQISDGQHVGTDTWAGAAQAQYTTSSTAMLL